jgi:hypothetical protein
MRLFENRFSEKYIDALAEKMSVGELKKTAISISDPKIYKGKKYENLIKLDYLGIGATVLFDDQTNACSVYDEIELILKSIKEINDSGYFVKIRILLEYPFSIAAYSRKLAELTSERAAIQDSQYLRYFNVIYDAKKHALEKSIDEKSLGKTYFVNSQKKMLERIGLVYDKYIISSDYGIWNDGLNNFSLRFIPFDPLMSCVFANDEVFYSVYLLAKEKRDDYKLKHCSPVINLTSEDKEIVSAFEDHFRYLWDLGVTMDASDVLDEKKSYSEIKSPIEVSYNDKAKRIKKYKGIEGDMYCDAQEELWRFYMKNVLQYLCAPVHELPKRETLFISSTMVKCEYTAAADYEDGVKWLQDTLESDFTVGDIKMLDVKLNNIEVGGGLSENLYPVLNKSTIGLVLMSGKMSCIDGKYYAGPNIYHELGYLMGRVKQGGIIVLQEKKEKTKYNLSEEVKVEVPTNIGNIIRLEFRDSDYYYIYPDIVKIICKKCFANDWLERVLIKYEKRFIAMLKDGQIDDDDYVRLIKKAGSLLKGKKRNRCCSKQKPKCLMFRLRNA